MFKGEKVGKRQERKERRAEAEVEVQKAFVESLDYMIAHPLKFGKSIRLSYLKDMAVARISVDTRFRFKDIVNYYLSRVRNFVKGETVG